MFGRLFRFAYISAWENDNSSICFWKMRHEKLYISCMNMALLPNKKRLPNIFIMLNTLGHFSTICGVHIEYGKQQENRLTEISVYSFYRAFHYASLNRTYGFYHVLLPRYMRNIKTVIEVLVHLVTIHFTTLQYFSCISLSFIYEWINHR